MGSRHDTTTRRTYSKAKARELHRLRAGDCCIGARRVYYREDGKAMNYDSFGSTARWRGQMYDPMQPYYNRNYTQHYLDEGTFVTLNQSGLDSSTISLMVMGCLDAIDSMPGGSIRGTKCGPIQSYTSRDSYGISAKDMAWREAFSEYVIAKLKENPNAKLS